MRLWRSNGLRFAGLSFVGLVFGHMASYALASDGAAEHAHLLASTGHGGWTLPITLAVGALIALVLGAVLRPAVMRESGITRASMVPRLVTLQVSAFLVLECAERTGAGHDPWSILFEPVVFLGIALQILIAFVAPLFLRLAAALGARLRSGSPADATSGSTLPHPPRAAHVNASLHLLVAWTLRGPPSASFSR